MSFNPVSRAVSVIRRTVPNQILNEAFIPKANQWIGLVHNHDEEIARQVIRPRVIVDCDIYGGHEQLIRMIDCRVERTQDLQTVIYVPKSVTAGRSITQVLSMTLMDARAAQAASSTAGYSACSVNPITMATAALAGSYDAPGVMSTSRLELIAENTILLKDSSIGTSLGTLRVVIANDENMNNLSIRFINHFVELCKLAVKSHIYNEMVVRMDEAEIQGGARLGAFRNIVETYADAEQQYQEYLQEKWQKVAIMNDRESYHNLIRAQIGGPR